MATEEQIASEFLGLCLSPEEHQKDLKEAFVHNVKLFEEAKASTEVETGLLDLSDLDKYELIEALWQNARVASFFFNPIAAQVGIPKGPTRAEIDQQMRNNSLDYLNGRAIKTDFSDMSKINTEGYDSRAYKGAFAKVVACLRKN